MRRFAAARAEIADASRPDSRASCRCTLTFHDCIDAFRNRGSTVAGARPAGRVASIALASGIEPAAVSGAANGGLPAVSLTAVVPGSSAAAP